MSWESISAYHASTVKPAQLAWEAPGLFFRQAGTVNVNRRALKLFAFVYLLLIAVPLTLIVISLFQEVAVYKLAMFASVLVFSLYTGIIRRQTIVTRFTLGNNA